MCAFSQSACMSLATLFCMRSTLFFARVTECSLYCVQDVAAHICSAFTQWGCCSYVHTKGVPPISGLPMCVPCLARTKWWCCIFVHTMQNECDVSFCWGVWYLVARVIPNVRLENSRETYTGENYRQTHVAFNAETT